MKVRCDFCRRDVEYDGLPTYAAGTLLYLCPSCNYVRGLKKTSHAPLDTPEIYANAKRRRDETRLAKLNKEVFGIEQIASGSRLDALAHLRGLTRIRGETDEELRSRVSSNLNMQYLDYAQRLMSRSLLGHEAYGVAIDEAVAYSAPVVQPPPVWVLQCKVCRVSFEASSRTPQWCVTCSAERTRRESAPGIESKFKYVTKPETRRAVEVVIDNSFWED